MLHRSALLFRKPLAIGATLAIALGGASASSPAFAEEAPPSAVAQLTDDPGTATIEQPETENPADESAPPSQADEQAFEAAGIDLVGVGVNAAGETVVVTTGGDIDSPAGQAAIEDFADSHGEPDEITTLQLEGPVNAVAANDLVGGAGYLAANTSTGTTGYCSLGFAAWSPSRKPAFITAGHCMSGPEDTLAVAVTPQEEPAAGGPGTVPDPGLPLIGWFGFAQYGGVGGTTGTNGDADSIDIAVIDVDEDEDWNLLPEVTDWTTPGLTPGSLAESTTKVERVGLPQLGPIARSGRTTGHEAGTVRPIDILDGWIQVSGRWVHGFSSGTYAIPGDSGGSVMQGTTAVGVVSGVAADVWGGPFLWSSLLQDSLPATGGYEVALDIAAPTTGTNNATMGDGIAVTVPTNATGLTVALNGQETALTPVDGVATVPTPAAGVYDYTFTATNGMSQSVPTAATVTVAPPAPTVTSITNGETFKDGATPKSVSGTGIEGATVEVALTTLAIALPGTSGAPANRTQPDVTYTATVQNGTWSVDLEPLGADDNGSVKMELAATQTANKVSSAPTTLEFTVYGQRKPMPPETTPTPGGEPAKALVNTGGPSVAPLGLAAGAALLLGALALGAAAIRRRNQATR